VVVVEDIQPQSSAPKYQFQDADIKDAEDAEDADAEDANANYL